MDNTNKYSKILTNSKETDTFFIKNENFNIEKFSLDFLVPKEHSRFKEISTYRYSVKEVALDDFENASVIVDPFFTDFLLKLGINNSNVFFIEPIEGITKEINYLNKFIEQNKDKLKNKIVAVGGNMILNIASYISEKTKCKDLTYIPTTVISMSDGSMGGKVRINKVEDGKFIKHYYKSFYEPNRILINPMFLNFLSIEQVSDGLSEIVKHGIFQSKKLLGYLNDDLFNPFESKRDLLKVILWTAALKKVCLDVDPEESEDGSYIVLRGGHDLSDRLEEESHFTLSHGKAVAIGVWEYVKNNFSQAELNVVSNVYERLHLIKKN